MSSDNINKLHEELRYLGFGDSPLLRDQLEQELDKGQKSFQLYTESFFSENCKLEVILYFNHAVQQGIYLFNRYDALLRYIDEPDRVRSQTFYIYNGTGITFKEAFNLLQGRAVHKQLSDIEGNKYSAWIQLNFEQKDLNNNYKVRQFRNEYELEKILEKYPIKEWKHDQLRKSLVRSLEKGNLHVVTFERKNKEEKKVIEANPQYKSINIYTINYGFK